MVDAVPLHSGFCPTPVHLCSPLCLPARALPLSVALDRSRLVLILPLPFPLLPAHVRAPRELHGASLGYGTATPNPATLLSSMVTNQYYYQELGGDVDVIVINVENFLISMFKSFTNQRLTQQFVARSTLISGQQKIRWVHRNLATTFTFEQAICAVGEDVVASDDYSTSNMATINQQLAPKYIQIFKAS